MWCQRILNKAFTKSIFNWEENKCSFLLMITNFHFIIITSANIQQLRWHQDLVLFNYKNKEMIEKETIHTEMPKKFFYQEIDYNVGDSILITSWHLELPNKKLEHLIEKSH